MKNNINRDLCEKCKLCIEVCPTNIIGINTKNEVSFIPEREIICLECGQCMSICKTKAITVNGYTYENDFIDLPENKINYPDFIDFLSNRRSIRNFKVTPVPDEMIRQLLDSISFAPYGSAPEKMNVSVINNRKTIETALPFIEKFLDDIVKWVENPFMSKIIKMKKGVETHHTIKHHLYPIAKLKNYKLEFGDRITRGAPAILVFHAKKDAEEHTNNALIYATYIMFTAQSMGLGATMIGIVPAAINKVETVRKIFNIPDENEAVMSVIVGYPKLKYKRTIKRKKLQVNWVK